MSNHRELHIVNGSSGGGILRQALSLSRDDILIHDDLLSCGPLLPLRTIDEWRTQRETYLRTLYPIAFSFDSVNHDLLSCTEDLGHANQLTLWLGTGLAEQLLFAWLIQVFRLLNIDLKQLRVIQFAPDTDAPDTEKGSEILGIGMLNAEQVRAHPEPFVLNEVSIERLDAAWTAVTSSSPARLLEFVAGNPGPLPFLQRSLKSLLTRFPHFDNGLNVWDFELLRQVVERGPTAVKVIGFTIIRLIDNLDCVGDAYLFARLKLLGHPLLNHPLVSLKGNLAEMRETEVTVTETGKAVLNGSANAVRLNGIDDWVGGIHLDSAGGEVWFERDGVLVNSSMNQVQFKTMG